MLHECSGSATKHNCRYFHRFTMYCFLSFVLILLCNYFIAVITNTTHTKKKLVIVGDPECGKTCLLYAINGNAPPPFYLPTLFENITTDVVAYGKQVWYAWDSINIRDARIIR